MIPLRRTKIVATLGPASDDADQIERLVRAGVDCFRLNFSHGTQDQHCTRVERVRDAQARLGRPLAILADLQGPKLRIGVLDEPRLLETGQTVVLAGRGDGAPGDLELGFRIDLASVVRPGHDVLIDDGLVRLRAAELHGRRVGCRVEIGGVVASQKGVNLPGAYLPIPSITDEDRDNLEFALDHDVDYVGQSFVRRAADVTELRGLIAERDARARVIAKIEKAEAIEHLEAIVDVTDGLMVARGDLGVEIGAADVPLTQKRIIALGREAGKPVITATQMLESMIDRPEPTRAEASDVANAILDGTSAVMLSGETAVGRYPLQAVQTMVRIALAVEPSLRYHDDHRRELSRLGARYIADVVGHAACDMAETLGVAAIVVPTVTGESAREVSKHRPRRPIVAASPQPGVLQQLALDWAVVPIPLEPAEGVEELWAKASEAVARSGLAAPGDRLVITSGTTVNRPGATNTILVHTL